MNGPAAPEREDAGPTDQEPEEADNTSQETVEPGYTGQEEGPLYTEADEDAFPEEDGTYNSAEDVALYLDCYGHLPDNYITKTEARELGWTGGSVEQVAPGCAIGGEQGPGVAAQGGLQGQYMAQLQPGVRLPLGEAVVQGVQVPPVVVRQAQAEGQTAVGRVFCPAPGTGPTTSAT